MNTTSPTLRPAKPYQGKAQHQAVRAALSRLGVTPTRSWSGRGWDMFIGSHRLDSHMFPAVIVSVGESRRADDVIDALRSAGWQCDEISTPESTRRRWAMYGPGAAEWLAARAEQRTAAAAVKASRTADAAVDAETLRSILRDAGITRWVRPLDCSGTAEVTLTLADVQRLIESVRS